AIMARSRQKHSWPVQRGDVRRRPPWGHQDCSPWPFEARPQRLVEGEARAGRAGGMSAAEDLYRASPIRRRHRSTKAEVEARREKLAETADAMKPRTVRQANARDVPAHISPLGDHDHSGVNGGEKIGLAP